MANPEIDVTDQAVWLFGCSSHMTGNKAYLSDYEDFNGGFVAFRSDPKGGKITGKGKIKTANLDFDDVYFVDELNFKLLDESQVVLRAPRKDDVYSLDLKNMRSFCRKSGRTTIRCQKMKHVWQDELEMMVTQELVANAMNDESRQAFEEEKRRIASQKKVAQATSTNQLSTDRPFVSTERIHKDHPKGQFLGDPTSAVQTIGKIQKASSAQQALEGYIHRQMKTRVERTMQEEIAPFQFTVGLVLKDMPNSKKAIGTNEVYAKTIPDEFLWESLHLLGLTGKSNNPDESSKVKDKYVSLTNLKKFVIFAPLKQLLLPIEFQTNLLVQHEDGVRFQVTPKASHLHAVKRIFRYLKHQPKLGLWYPRDSPFELEAFSDSDYAGASLDRKSTTGGCQFLGRRLISWQCKKQTIVANSTTEAEYVAAAHCCGQIRHHFIRDCNEKRLIDVLKIHTDSNVADLLTKRFDVTRISMDLRMDRCSPGKY
ncbi:hypothetical protein Tco_1490854 [Tanacetum coccineum]